MWLVFNGFSARQENNMDISVVIFFLIYFWPPIVVGVFAAKFWGKYALILKFFIIFVIYIISMGSCWVSVQYGGEQESIMTSVLAPIVYSFLAHVILSAQAQEKTAKGKIKSYSRSKSKPLSPSRISNIFICYRRVDSENITGRIYDRLLQHYGKEAVFKDVDSIPLGLDFREYLDDVVGRCQVLLVVIVDEWLS